MSVLLAFVGAAFLLNGCARAPKDEADPKAVRAEILGIENQWAAAVEQRDAAAFERLAAEDFRFIDENGRVLDRAQYIADRSHNADVVESAVQDDIEVHKYGDVAIATGRSILHGKRNGTPFVYRFRGTGVYSRQSGRWRAVSGFVLVRLYAALLCETVEKRTQERLVTGGHLHETRVFL